MKRPKTTYPEIYSDFNARKTDDGFSLERQGTADDLAKIGLYLASAVGQRFDFVVDDTDDDGQPDGTMDSSITRRCLARVSVASERTSAVAECIE